MQPTDYTAPLGVVKSLEAKLISEVKMRRLAESADATDFLRGLSDTVYGGATAGAGVHVALAAEAAAAARLLARHLRDDALRRIFLGERDLAVVKAVLKKRLAETAASAAAPPPAPAAPGLDAGPPPAGPRGCSETGLANYAALTAAVKENKFHTLPEPLAEISAAVLRLKKPPSPAAVDTVADAVFFEWAAEKARPFPVAAEYIRLLSDIANISEYARGVLLPETARAAAESINGTSASAPGSARYFSTGSIDKSVFLAAETSAEISDGDSSSARAAAANRLASFFSQIKLYRYRGLTDPAALDRDPAAAVSKFSDDAKTEFWKKARFEPFGFHHICGYVHAKSAEIKNIGMISAGIGSHASPDEIKTRLLRAYA